MGNPKAASLPFMIIDFDGQEFSVSVWHPPLGIWRQSDKPDLFSSFERALGAASFHARSTGSTLAITQDATRAVGSREQQP